MMSDASAQHGPAPGTPGPLIVVGADDVTAVVAELRGLGWAVTALDEVPDEPWEMAGSGCIATATVDEPAAGRALELAGRGVGLAVTVAIDDPVAAESFVDQLARIGPVTERSSTSTDFVRPLSAEEKAVLDALASGSTIQEAADALFVSLRTANRRLASARAALGVSTNRAAVVAHRSAEEATP